MRYIKEIDGLRAIAIISVVLYHAGLTFFPGGFVGVDIFFVISGYLITTTIRNDILVGRFSIIDFYQRRARRILPALFFMLLIISILAAGVLLPEHFKRYGASLIALMFFMSNMYFWLRVQDVGYFTEGARNFPLLHTWSLSVEEQFYVIFPFFLLLVLSWSRRRSFVIMVMGIATCISFAFSLWLLSLDQRAAFYASPARAWELMIGAMCACAPNVWMNKRWQREMIAVLGLGLICLAVFSFNFNMEFPGIRAIAPTFGAAFIILAATHGATKVSQMLTLRPIRFFGLISYSLYLWHWPLITLASYFAIEKLTITQMSCVVGASVLLATFSWYYIEQPVRTKKIFPTRKSVFLWSAAMGCCALIVGGVTQLQNGIAFRGLVREAVLENYYKAIDLSHQSCMRKEGSPIDKVAPCHFNVSGHRQIVLWGDSHSDAVLGSMIVAVVKKDAALTYYAEAGCPPILGFNKGLSRSFLYSGKKSTCSGFNQEVVSQIIADPRPALVFLVARWGVYVRGDWGHGPAADAYLPIQILDNKNDPIEGQKRYDLIADELKETISKLQAANKQVVIMYPIPEIGYNVPLTAARKEMYGRYGLNIDLPTKQYGIDEALVQHLLDNLDPSIIRIYPENVFCDMTYCHISLHNNLLYYDDNHPDIYAYDLLEPLEIQAIKSWK